MNIILFWAIIGCRNPDKTIVGGVDETPSTPIPEEENTETVTEEDDSGSTESDPSDRDSDNDGLTDAEEEVLGTDPNNPDSDGDGITDKDEETVGTDPNNRDSDDDGVSDGDEIIIGIDPNDADSDDDGISDGEEIDQGTDPTREDTDGDGVNDGEELANGTDPTDDGTEDTDDVWDWGDNANSNCPGCDPAIFSGIYDLDLTFQSSINNTVLCTSTPTTFLSSIGTMAFASSCTSSTGATFDFDFDLYVSYNNPYASEEYGVMAGTVSITIPNGTVYSSTLAPQSSAGFVTTLCCENFGPYSDIFFIWRPIIQTPSGDIEYIVYFQGFKQ